jgi:predicted RNase H-like HicB family nuclease
MKYLVIIEKGPRSFGAYVPDLPGCVAVGKTLAQAKRLIREAIDFHLEAMREHGEKIPRPTSKSDYVETTAA